MMRIAKTCAVVESGLKKTLYREILGVEFLIRDNPLIIEYKILSAEGEAVLRSRYELFDPNPPALSDAGRKR